jgi:DNA-binding HxlR family transcriptional regulator
MDNSIVGVATETGAASDTTDRATETSGGLSDALAALGDRWSMLVVAALFEGPKRFGDLQDEVSGIAPNVLSARLRKLADHGLISARAYSDRPPRFSYELTDAGRELRAPLRLLAAWAERHARGEPPRHEPCGTELEVAWYCPTCREVVGGAPGAEDELHYA